jgi:hypothetical protein
VWRSVQNRGSPHAASGEGRDAGPRLAAMQDSIASQVLPAASRDGFTAVRNAQLGSRVLAAERGHAEAILAMLDIHKKGGRLFPTVSPADAQRIAEAISAASSARGHSLVCRAVGTGS